MEAARKSGLCPEAIRHKRRTDDAFRERLFEIRATRHCDDRAWIRRIALEREDPVLLLKWLKQFDADLLPR